MVFLGSPAIITRNVNLEKSSTEFQIVCVLRLKFHLSLAGTEKTAVRVKLRVCVCVYVCTHTRAQTVAGGMRILSNIPPFLGGKIKSGKKLQAII